MIDIFVDAAPEKFTTEQIDEIKDTIIEAAKPPKKNNTVVILLVIALAITVAVMIYNNYQAKQTA